MLSYSIVLYIVIAVMCICMISKCLSRDVDQQQDQGKPSLKSQAKPYGGNCWAFYFMWWVQRVSLPWERSKDGLICTATLGCSSMYKIMCFEVRTLCLTSNDIMFCECICNWFHFLSASYIKIYHKTGAPVWAYAFVLEIGIVACLHATLGT